LKLDRVQSGPFQVITSANDAVVQVVADRSVEGSIEMAGIAEGLRMTALAYDLRDHDVVKDMRSI
jgi:antitoxin (DNA-binding transcriptional repressor) of toxin-antitoxin stability system